MELPRALVMTNPWPNVWTAMALFHRIFVSSKIPNRHVYSIADRFHSTICLVTIAATSFPVDDT